MTNEMNGALEQYRQAKADVAKLEDQARKELISRFHELQAEIERVRAELRELGVKSVPKAPTKKRAKKANADPKTLTKSAGSVVETAKTTRLMKRIEIAKKNQATAKSAEVAKRFSDLVYELEDELRLEREK